MKPLFVLLIVAMFAVGAAQVVAAQGQGHGKGQAKGHAQDYSQYDDKGTDKDAHKGDASHGQVVSDCNHRANDRNLKGQDRKDFVEWCESRGGRHKYDYGRYDGEKSCYQKANNKGLTGDKRQNFLQKCFAERGDDYYGGKVPVKKKD